MWIPRKPHFHFCLEKLICTEVLQEFSCNIFTKAFTHWFLVVRFCFIVMEYFILISEDIVVHIILLGRLWCQDKCLHEPPHRLSIVWQLTRHLQQTFTCIWYVKGKNLCNKLAKYSQHVIQIGNEVEGWSNPFDSQSLNLCLGYSCCATQVAELLFKCLTQFTDIA